MNRIFGSDLKEVSNAKEVNFENFHNGNSRDDRLRFTGVRHVGQG